MIVTIAMTMATMGRLMKNEAMWFGEDYELAGSAGGAFVEGSGVSET
jgi:hypothetical protein